MVTIKAIGRDEARDWFCGLGVGDVDELSGLALVVPPDRLSFLQASYDEVSPDDLDVIFAYAGIADSNAPFGLPFAVEPRLVGSDGHLFPLAGLMAHLAASFPTCVEMARQAVTGDDDLTDVEAFTAALYDLADACVRYRLGLSIRW